MKRRIFCAVMTVVLVLTMLPVIVAAEGAVEIAFTQRETKTGATQVQVGVAMSNNPGLVTATIPVTWNNDVLHLANVIPSEDILSAGWIGMSMDEYESNGTYYLAWDNDLAEADFTTEVGCLAELVFDIVDPSKDTNTTLAFNMDDPIANVMNFAMEDLRETVTVNAANGTVSVAAEAGGDNPVVDPDALVVEVGTDKGKIGDVVEVPIKITQNPGLTVLTLEVNYSEHLTLTAIKDAGVLGSNVHGKNLESNPIKLYWNNDTASENFYIEDTIATLEFTINENAPLGNADIYLEAGMFYILDVDANEVPYNFVDGCVEVIEYIPGDIDGDGNVATPKDAMYLARYIAGWEGYDELIDLNGTDIDGDGNVATPRDAMYLARYIAGWEGYDEIPVVLDN